MELLGLYQKIVGLLPFCQNKFLSKELRSWFIGDIACSVAVKKNFKK